jgi:hypothetical protein
MKKAVEAIGKGRRMPPFMRDGSSNQWRKKLCACCGKPFHKVKRPKAAIAVQDHGNGVTTEDRYLCRPCVARMEREGTAVEAP